MSIKELWDLFHTKCYPNGMMPDQEQQLRMTFYAGAYSVLEELRSTPKMSGSVEKGVMHLQSLYEEGQTFFIEEIGKAMKEL